MPQSDEFAARIRALESIPPKETKPWPSREPAAAAAERPQDEPQGQITMRGRQAVIDRFRALCKADRRTYIDMLEILMDRAGEGFPNN